MDYALTGLQRFALGQFWACVLRSGGRRAGMFGVYTIVVVVIFTKLISVQYLHILFHFVLGRNYGERVKSVLTLHLFQIHKCEPLCCF